MISIPAVTDAYNREDISYIEFVRTAENPT